MEPGAGPLMQNVALEHRVAGVEFRKGDPTRREEYHWAVSVVRATTTLPERDLVILDAGCGFDPTIHLFPYMLAKFAGLVLAVDANPEHMQMPVAPGIFRLMGDITRPSGAQACVDIYTCISVLEHLPAELRMSAFIAAFEILKPGGLLIMTADEVSPVALNGWAKAVGFETGPITEGTSDLSPGVSWLVARKP
jgi:SAM-dependent methyltransferase